MNRKSHTKEPQIVDPWYIRTAPRTMIGRLNSILDFSVIFEKKK